MFNPNIWTGDPALSKAALRAEDARANKEVGALIEEVAALPGIPEKHVQSTEKKWVDFAVSQGLVERSVVQTSTGGEEGFLFAPHLKRDAFGVASSDPSGHVRQMVGSMIYATTFATTYRLRSPARFCTRSSATVKLAMCPTSPPTTRCSSLPARSGSRPAPGEAQPGWCFCRPTSPKPPWTSSTPRDRSRGAVGSLQALGEQRAYSHIERERARMAASDRDDDEDQARLIAALRDATSGGGFGG